MSKKYDFKVLESGSYIIFIQNYVKKNLLNK